MAAEKEGGSRPDDSDAAPSTLEAASEEAREDLETLRKGPSISILGAELPARALIAMGIFLVAFMIVWMLLWAAFDGLGLGLGWIVAAAVGGAAVKLYGNRS